MALPYVTPGQLALVENKINDFNEKLTDDDIESIKAMQSPKDATAGTVLTADGHGKATYKPTSTAKHLYGIGMRYELVDKATSKTVLSFLGYSTYATDEETKPTFDFPSQVNGLVFGGTGTINTADASGTVGIIQLINGGVGCNLWYIDANGSTKLWGMSYDRSKMEQRFQVLVGDKIQ